MPNIKSAKKRVEVAKVNAAKNAIVKTSIKTSLKKFDEALNSNDKDTVKAAFENAVSTVDKAVTKGVMKKNTANNRKATLGKRYDEAMK